MTEAIEKKLTALRENQKTIVEQINNGEKVLIKAKADLNAIMGAIQVCEQLLEEGKKDDGKN